MIETLHEVIRWLAEEDNPSVSFLVRKEFSGIVPGGAPDPASHPYAASILEKADGGIAGDAVHYDQWYRGSAWAFAELVSMGLTVENIVVKKTADYLVDIAQTQSGGFTMNWAPPFPAAGWTGDILFYLLKSGYSGDPVRRAAEWLVSIQNEDGGWSHSPIGGFRDTMMFSLFGQSGKTREEKPDSSFLSTVSCGRALALYASVTGTGIGPAKRASEFVLNRKRLLSRVHKGGELYMFNPSFRRIGFPVLCQHDILSAMIFIAEAGSLEDERAAQPFNIIMRERFDDGTFPCTGRAAGSLHAKYRLKKNRPDKWTTLQAVRLMKFLKS
jgi:hypothetical protein